MSIAIEKTKNPQGETVKQTLGALRAANLVMTLLKWPKTDRDAYRESVAQLIDNETAAPELLEALRAMLNAYAPNADWTKPSELHSAVLAAGNAISKAEGK